MAPMAEDVAPVACAASRRAYGARGLSEKDYYSSAHSSRVFVHTEIGSSQMITSPTSGPVGKMVDTEVTTKLQVFDSSCQIRVLPGCSRVSTNEAA